MVAHLFLEMTGICVLVLGFASHFLANQPWPRTREKCESLGSLFTFLCDREAAFRTHFSLLWLLVLPHRFSQDHKTTQKTKTTSKLFAQEFQNQKILQKLFKMAHRRSTSACHRRCSGSSSSSSSRRSLDCLPASLIQEQVMLFLGPTKDLLSGLGSTSKRYRSMAKHDTIWKEFCCWRYRRQHNSPLLRTMIDEY